MHSFLVFTNMHIVCYVIFFCLCRMHRMMYRILVHRPGIESLPLAVEANEPELLNCQGIPCYIINICTNSSHLSLGFFFLNLTQIK